jgi:hypothetical protein
VVQAQLAHIRMDQVTDGGRQRNRPEALELERVHARSMEALRGFNDESLRELKEGFVREQDRVKEQHAAEMAGLHQVTIRARWVTLRARWVTLRARWVTLRARWVMLRSRWVTLRARWVTLRARLGDAKSSLGDADSLLGDAESSLDDADSLLGDAES